MVGTNTVFQSILTSSQNLLKKIPELNADQYLTDEIFELSNNIKKAGFPILQEEIAEKLDLIHKAGEKKDLRDKEKKENPLLNASKSIRLLEEAYKKMQSKIKEIALKNTDPRQEILLHNLRNINELKEKILEVLESIGSQMQSEDSFFKFFTKNLKKEFKAFIKN